VAGPRRRAGPTTALLLALFFASGFAALVYQVLWVRQIGLLVGSTAQAAALTIAIFFAGIAAGGWWWGRRAATVSPLRTFGLLELGVAVTALGHFVLVDAYAALYPFLFAAVGDVPALDTLSKAVIATLILLPPSFLMGGTLPMMGQHLVRARDRLATTGSALYAVNTAGSATGALAAGFVLPLLLGISGAYLLAVGVDLAVGLACLGIAARAQRPASTTGVEAARSAIIEASPPTHVATSAAPRRVPLPHGIIWAVAVLSGFVTLAVEVIWTRLFSQVLQNSAYTYALVLTAFLIALSLGAGLAGLLARQRRVQPEVVLTGLLLLAGTATAASPWLFDRATGGLSYLGADLGWNGYVLAVAGLAIPVLLLPGVVLGTVLPYLLRLLQDGARAPGEALGRLVAGNTVGAIAGALGAGFVILPAIGAWRGLLLLAAVYPMLVTALAAARLLRTRRADPAARVRRLGTVATAGVVMVGLLALDVPGPTGSAHAPAREHRGERMVEAREGSQANVAVIGRGRDRLIRVDSTYTLGGSRGRHTEQNQSVIPLLTGEASSVFYLGMGTGITAGAALDFPVERVVVCELIADVVELAEAHFARWTRGLFDDDRVTVHAEDGRSCLRRSPERFDLVISDLFTPWQAGTGNLYTVEHYRTARERLAPGGRMVQWVPLYQVSPRELAIIAATMDEAFEQVTMWRGDLFAERSIVALVGQADATPLDPSVIAARRGRCRGPRTSPLPSSRRSPCATTRATSPPRGSSLLRPGNTDTRPLIEYLAPRTHREVRAGTSTFVVGEERERLYAALREAVDVEDDPHLVRLDARQRGYVRAGDAASRAAWLAADGRDVESAAAEAEEAELVPTGALAERSPARALLGR
jgi:spermidine synthase